MDIKKDEWAIVLDFLSKGHYGMTRSQPVAQVLGDKYFSLLEVIVREGESLKTGERVYIGDKKRDKIKYISGRIKVEELTTAAKDEVEFAVKEIVQKNPEQFVAFFNDSGSITTRMHQLELLPGIGRKQLWKIIEERQKETFKSFEDIKSRVPLLQDPEKMIIKRIQEEIEEKDRYSLFVLRPKEQTQERRQYQQRDNSE